MRVLDLFCGAGGAAMGLHRAWSDAEITGVDIKPQPHFPFHFVQADAMTFPLGGYAFIWASPPCERYSQCTPKAHRNKHPDLIRLMRERLKGETGSWQRYVIENVPSARELLQQPIMLCGSLFGLKLRRHRFFECGRFFPLAMPCAHIKSPVLVTGTHRRTYEPRYEYTVTQCREAMGIPWMTRAELDKAIPPAYSEFIAKQVPLREEGENGE